MIEHVRRYLAERAGVRQNPNQEYQLYAEQVDAYIETLARTREGHEAHAETLRALRADANTALARLQVRSERKKDYLLERYVTNAQLYMAAMEAAMSGEGAGEYQIEETRYAYEAARGMI